MIKPIDYTWVIDDDSIFVYTIKKMMRMYNLTNRLETFSNGKEAQNQLIEIQEGNKKYPDVIFLDINMPILDGWQFMEQFSKFPDKDNIIVYLISSSIDPEDKERSKNFDDIKGFVVKPLTSKSLIDLIDKSQSLMDISQS